MMQQIPASDDAQNKRNGLTIEASGTVSAANPSKVNWNNLHTTFRPRSSKQQPPHYKRQPPLTSDDLCWGGSASAKVNGVGAAPASLAARPQSGRFPVRFQRSAKRRNESAAAAAAAAAEASESEALIAELWRLDDPDEDIVELDDLFDQMAQRDPAKRRVKKPLRQKQRQVYPRPRSSASVVPPRHQKSANQLYQEHLLAEVAKHRQKNSEPRPVPPELSLFIPKTRTRLCRLYTGNCLIRSASAPPPGNVVNSDNNFLPITRSIMPLPAELRPLSRQGWSLGGGGSGGGIVQISPDSCQCRLSRRSGSGVVRSGLRSSAYSDNCSVCRRLRMLQLV
ncbi:hypothetical protein BOX15_Mlig006721g2 [Macrostomum lignano]|uniref:Uncharacterized protein n=1 Tax=Macrostomum lignano TaxID=282301 RepID=A0A267EVY0_9PLAT|nr:hypothetical protein BOX15_Mlig006721g2 [Macrostomum lignano]